MSYLTSSEVRKDEKARTTSYFCTKDTVIIDQDAINELVQESKDNDNSDVRISLHKGPEDTFHNMIILQTQGKYYRPHKHAKKVEVYQMIIGEMLIVIFNEDGTVRIKEKLSLSDKFIFRIPANTHHVTIPLTEHAVFHESKPGPFEGKGDSIFLEGTPERDDLKEGLKYFEKLKE